MKITVRAARILYNLPNNMVYEDALRHARGLHFLCIISRIFLDFFIERIAHPYLVYEDIGRNRVSTYFTRDQNRLLVQRYVSRPWLSTMTRKDWRPGILIVL